MRWFLQLLRCQRLTGLVWPELRSSVWEPLGVLGRGRSAGFWNVRGLKRGGRGRNRHWGLG